MNLSDIEQARSQIWYTYVSIVNNHNRTLISPSVRYSKATNALVVKARCSGVMLGEPLHLPFHEVVGGDLAILDRLLEHAALAINLASLLDSVTEQ